MILKISLLSCLMWMFYQDMRFRAIYWISFPLMTILLIMCMPEHLQLRELLRNTISNLFILLIQIFFVSVWFSVKNGRVINITDSHIGWGDLLFLISLAFYLSPGNYFLFYVSSLVLVLLISFPSLIKGQNDVKIPLAGLQSLFLGILLTLIWTDLIPDLTKDNWIIDRFER